MTVGLYFVIIIQTLGPLSIIFYATYNLERKHEGLIGYSQWYYIPNSEDNGISNITKRFLALLFIVLFTLNGTYVMDTDRKCMEKTLDMCAVFREVSREDDRI